VTMIETMVISKAAPVTTSAILIFVEPIRLKGLAVRLYCLAQLWIATHAHIPAPTLHHGLFHEEVVNKFTVEPW